MRKMILAVVFAVLLGLPAAYADPYVFDFTFTGVNANTVDAHGQFTATKLHDGIFQITGLTGIYNGQAMSLSMPRTA